MSAKIPAAAELYRDGVYMVTGRGYIPGGLYGKVVRADYSDAEFDPDGEFGRVKLDGVDQRYLIDRYSLTLLRREPVDEDSLVGAMVEAGGTVGEVVLVDGDDVVVVSEDGKEITVGRDSVVTL